MPADKLFELTTSGNFRHKVAALIRDLEGHGFDPKIAEAKRTVEQQREKVRKGFSKTMRSKHLPGRDGLARAADVVSRSKGWNASREYWLKLGASALAHEMGWGGFFGLNRKMTAALMAELKARNWDTSAKMGWDPAHVEQV